MILLDPTYTSAARSDLQSLGKAAAWHLKWLRQWVRGEVSGRIVALSYTNPDPRAVILPGGMAAAFTTMAYKSQRLRRAPLIVRIVPERELEEHREEILKAILQADDEA